MKVKCDSCGKRFETDMYSGICPRCGKFHVTKEDAADIYREFQENVSEEAQPQELHEEYGQASQQEAVGQEYSAGPGYAAAQNDGAGQHADQPSPGISFRRVRTIIAIILIPFVFAAVFQLWKTAVLADMKLGRMESAAAEAHALTLDCEGMEYPVSVELLGAGLVSPEGVLPEGQSLAAVKALVKSRDYSFEAGLSFVALSYEYEGNTYYRTPIDWYDLKVCRKELGISQDDVLSTYRVGNGSEEEGYWFFPVDDGAKNMELILMVEENDYPQKVIAEGTLSVQGLSLPDFAEKEVE